MNIEQAKAKVVEELEKISQCCPHSTQFVLMEDSTIEKPWGWVFFYQNKQFVDTKTMVQQIAANAPFIVNRRTGKVTKTGTAYDLTQYLQVYEAML
jgi:hypothetical protein